MPQIKTEITINASKEKIWQALTDFKAYPNWNPFIVRIEGGLKPQEDIRFKAHVNGKKFKFGVKVKRSEPNAFLSWTGPGSPLLRLLFAGEHYFQIEELQGGQCRFVHGETFSGAAMPLVWSKLKKAESAYSAMNKELKALVE